jgi:hypothetical protein
MKLQEVKGVNLVAGDETFRHEFSLPKIDRVAMKAFQKAAAGTAGDSDAAKAALMSAGAETLEEIYDASIVAVSGYEIDGHDKQKLAHIVPLIPLMHKIQAVSAIVSARMSGGVAVKN